MFKNAFYSPLIIFFLLAGWSCRNTREPQFEIKAFEKKSGDCNAGSCIDIDLKYHQVKKGHPAAAHINRIIEHRIFSKMGSEKENLEPEEFLKRILKDFEAFKKEYPDASSGGYQQRSTSEITYQSRDLISVLITSDVYAGGAHPMNYKEFVNFNPDNGEEIEINQLIKNQFGFKDLVETRLREWFGMLPDDRWSDFTLVDTFVMPETMGFTPDGMLLIYNEYEILPYSSGTVELTLTFEELAPLLKKPIEVTKNKLS